MEKTVTEYRAITKYQYPGGDYVEREAYRGEGDPTVEEVKDGLDWSEIFYGEFVRLETRTKTVTTTDWTEKKD